MKKIIIAAIAALAVGATVSAQSLVGQIDIGVRGMGDANLGTALSSDYFSGYSVEQSLVIGYGATAFANIAINAVPGLAIQPEVSVQLNNGIKTTNTYSSSTYNSTSTLTGSYTSVDIPLLVTYKINLGKFNVSPLAGIYVSLPVSKFNYSYDSTSTSTYFGSSSYSVSYDYKISNSVIFGGAVGCSASYAITDKIAALADVRYISDFSAIKLADASSSIFTRRQLQVSLGAKYSL